MPISKSYTSEKYLTTDFRLFLLDKFWDRTSELDLKVFFIALLSHAVEYCDLNDKQAKKLRLTTTKDSYVKYLERLDGPTTKVPDTLVRNYGFKDTKMNSTVTKNHLKMICFVFGRKANEITQQKFEKIPDNAKKLDRISSVQPSTIANAASETGKIAVSTLPCKDDFKEVSDVLLSNYKSHRFEDALTILIEQFNQPNLSDVTIVTEDLSFTFKIAVTLIKFLSNPKNRISLLFAPKHGFAILNSKEFLMLYKLGVKVRILDFKETFIHQGFYFNYYFPEGNPENHDVVFLQIKNNLFERSEVIVRHTSQSDPDYVFINSLKDISNKSNAGIVIKSDRPPQISKIEIPEYCQWLLDRFKGYQIYDEEGNKLNRPIPAYIPFMLQSFKIKFEYLKVPFDKIFYRTNRVVTYKIYQAQKLMENSDFYSKFEGDTLSFIPLNLFNNDGGQYYPVNPPFLEYHKKSDRYEIAEGHSRLFIASNHPEVKYIETIVVTNLPEAAFAYDFRYIDMIGKDWPQVAIKHEHFSEENTVVKSKRKLESAVTHSISPGFFAEVGRKLVRNRFLTYYDAVRYSYQKYGRKKRN